MSKAKQRKKGKKGRREAASISINERLKDWWSAKSSTMKFLLYLGAVMIVFYIFWNTDFFKDNILSPWNHFNAWVVSGVLSLLGHPTVAHADQIVNKMFSMEVRQGCDAIEPTVLFAAGVLLFPSPWRLKWKGLLFGVIFLLGLNMIRLISLWFVGRFWHSAFEIMHVEVWQVVFILLACLLWGYWLYRVIETLKKEKGPAS